MENNVDHLDAKNKERRAMKVILSIFLLLICCVTAIGYSSYAYVKSVATQQAIVMANTQAATTNEAATAQVFATATSIKYATQIAGYEIFDDFDSNPHHWHVKTAENSEYWTGSIDIRDGLYVWDITKVKDPGSYSWRGYDNQGSFQDFDLSIDAKLEKGSPELLCYGIAFRVSPRSFNSGAYMFSICDAGVYEVKYHNNVSGSEVISSWTQTPLIRSGEWNTISIKAQDENIVISINHSTLIEFADKHPAKGYVYLLARMFDNQPGTLYFDNFAFQPR